MTATVTGDTCTVNPSNALMSATGRHLHGPDAQAADIPANNSARAFSRGLVPALSVPAARIGPCDKCADDIGRLRVGISKV